MIKNIINNFATYSIVLNLALTSCLLAYVLSKDIAPIDLIRKEDQVLKFVGSSTQVADIVRPQQIDGTDIFQLIQNLDLRGACRDAVCTPEVFEDALEADFLVAFIKKFGFSPVDQYNQQLYKCHLVNCDLIYISPDWVEKLRHGGMPRLDYIPDSICEVAICLPVDEELTLVSAPNWDLFDLYGPGDCPADAVCIKSDHLGKIVCPDPDCETTPKDYDDAKLEQEKTKQELDDAVKNAEKVAAEKKAAEEAKRQNEEQIKQEREKQREEVAKVYDKASSEEDKKEAITGFSVSKEREKQFAAKRRELEVRIEQINLRVEQERRNLLLAAGRHWAAGSRARILEYNQRLELSSDNFDPNFDELDFSEYIILGCQKNSSECFVPLHYH